MAERVELSNVRFSPACTRHQDSGLLASVGVTLNGVLHLDGLILRKGGDGRLTLSFPTHTDADGDLHFYFRPASKRVRREFEHQIIAVAQRLAAEHL